MPEPSAFKPRMVAILAYPGAQLLDVCGPLQVFSTANDLSVARGGLAPYQCKVVSKEASIATTTGISLSSHPLSSVDCPIDTLVVVGGAGFNQAAKDQELVEWLRHHSGAARRVVSVCTGAFLLAEAGLLRGRRIATHWQYFTEFGRRFPDVSLDTQSIFVEDDNVWTSGGVTAGMDLSLALVERDLGRPIALAIAQYLVMFLKRTGGQSQFSSMLALQQGVEFDDLHAWINANISKNLTIDVLADQAGMSRRNFSRRYKEATGKTPIHAVEELRIDAARRLLEQGLSVAVASRRCGFGSQARMARAFSRILKVSPRNYSDHFGPRRLK